MCKNRVYFGKMSIVDSGNNFVWLRFLNRTATATLKATVSNQCGEQVFRIGVMRAVCTYEYESKISKTIFESLAKQ